MGLWFKKKTEQGGAALETKMPDVKQASEPSRATPEHSGVNVPSTPLVQPTFKLPPLNTPDPKVANSGEASIPPAIPEPSLSATAVIAESLYARPTPSQPPEALAESLSDQTEEQAASADIKSLLKPIILKPKIQVADKTAVPPPKTETVAADLPAVSRTDPKALYYQLMNGLYDVIFVLDDGGHVIDCNSRSEEIFGYSPDDVWNMPIEKIVYGMNNRMFNLLKKNLANKRHILIDARCFRSSGTSFLAEVGVSTVQLTRSQNVVFSIRNVERRKNSAEELRKYRAALDVLSVPAFTCDLHGAFEVLNPPVLKALGMVDEMEAQKKHFGEMLPDMIEQFQAAVKGVDVCETKDLTRPDGSVYTIELRLKPMRKGEEITGVAGTMTIT